MSQEFFLIFGCGRSGFDAALLLHKNGFDIRVVDSKLIQNQFKQKFDDLKIPYEENFLLEKLEAQCRAVICSPGILMNHPLLVFARSKGIPIFGEIECALWFLNPESKKIAITGTNGKSTTTHFLSHIFESQKLTSYACGNLGDSLSSVAINDLKKQPEYICVELSSYQLESTYSAEFDVTIFLNIQNDHLARYGSIDEYFKAKWRMVLMTKSEGLCILDYYVFEKAVKLGLSLPKCKISLIVDYEKKPVGPYLNNSRDLVTQKLEKGKQLPVSFYKNLDNIPVEKFFSTLNISFIGFNYNSKNNSCQFNLSDKKSIFLENQVLLGSHNSFNILSCIEAAHFLGIDLENIRKECHKEHSTYKSLAHRLQIVFESKSNSGLQKNITIINDSKATNVESTLVALKSITKPIRLLLGGEPKGDSFTPIVEFLGKGVVKIYPFGQAGNIIYEALSTNKNNVCPPCKTMLDAANQAFIECTDGEVILLSPACSSFDEFRNFEHRGDVFKQWAQNVTVLYGK